MELIILRTNLKDGLSKIERGVIENNNLPILKNVLIKADGKVKLAATNLEIGVYYWAAGKVVEKGGITVPFVPLYNIVNNSDSERITLSTEGATLKVKTDNYEAKIQGVPEEDFPIIPEIKEREGDIKISAQILKEAISQVVSAAQFSELKPELNGILFDFQVTVLKLAATDSYRLAEKTLLNNAFKTTFTKGLKIIIPLRTIGEVLRIFSDEEEVEIVIDEHQIMFQTQNTYLISRLIDGEYPEYQAIIPKETKVEISLERDQLITGIKLVSNFSGRTNDIRLRSKGEGKALEIYSNNQYLGENAYLVPIKSNNEEVEEVVFNWRYLMDGLKSITTETITFGINGPQKPAILKPAEDNSLFYIVMPLER